MQVSSIDIGNVIIKGLLSELNLIAISYLNIASNTIILIIPFIIVKYN